MEYTFQAARRRAENAELKLERREKHAEMPRMAIVHDPQNTTHIWSACNEVSTIQNIAVVPTARDDKTSSTYYTTSEIWSQSLFKSTKTHPTGCTKSVPCLELDIMEV